MWAKEGALDWESTRLALSGTLALSSWRGRMRVGFVIDSLGINPSFTSWELCDHGPVTPL